MADFSQLPNDITQLIKNVNVSSERRLRTVSLQIFRALTLANPKKTGRSAGNWQVGIGQPLLTQQEPPAPPASADDEARLGAANAFVGQQTAKGVSTISNRPIGGDGTIYISNIVPYVVPLNTYRPSRQAKPGWVERAIRVGSR